MKRYGNLYKYICDIDNIKLAHRNASKGKKSYTDVQLVDSNINRYCEEIKKMLESKTYVVADYRVKSKMDKGKLRTLYILPYYPDRIIQHAIMQVLEPIWKKVLIRDTFQSIKGRGVHEAKRRVERYIRKCKPKYSLKVDVKKFYPSISNKVLKRTTRKKIKCKGTLWLLDSIIGSLPGLPIGNYISQYLGNLTLAYMDHSTKEKFKDIAYFRYCDDIVVLSNSKAQLHEVLGHIREVLVTLGLRLNKNYQVSVINDRGVDFVGFVFRSKRTKIRNSIAKKLVKADNVSVCSYFGWAKACRAKGLWNKHIKIRKAWKW